MEVEEERYKIGFFFLSGTLVHDAYDISDPGWSFWSLQIQRLECLHKRLLGQGERPPDLRDELVVLAKTFVRVLGPVRPKDKGLIFSRWHIVLVRSTPSALLAPETSPLLLLSTPSQAPCCNTLGR